MRKFGRYFFILFCLLLITVSAAHLVPKAHAASAMTASEACVGFIKDVEGFSPQPYYDYNQYTVGYGTKCPTEKYFEYMANGIPKKEAETLLRQCIADIENAINGKLIDKYNILLTQNQFDALVSFSFNIGTGWITYDSTLRNAILRNANDNELVYAFGLYCTAGGKYLPGLITRRLCEANIYINSVYHQKVSDAYGYVYYDANGGSLTYRVQGYVCDNTTVPVTNATKSNDVFLGWYTSLTGGTQVNVLTRELSGRTLFARWQSSEDTESPDTTGTNVKVTGDVVNVRGGPGTNYGVLKQIYRGTPLTVTHVTHLTSVKWGKIQDGWICLDYTDYDAVISGTGSEESKDAPADTTVSEQEKPTDTNTAPVEPILTSGIVRVNDALRIRSGPGTNYAVVGFLFNGKEVNILELKTAGTGVWGRVATGWISMDYVETSDIYDDPPEPAPAPELRPEPVPEPETQPAPVPEQTPNPTPEQIPEQVPEREPEVFVGVIEAVLIQGNIKADALRVRSEPGTNHPIVAFYYQDDAVTITQRVLVDTVYWGKTNLGWINMDYVVATSASAEPAPPAAADTRTVTGDCLRIRKEPGTDHRISGLLYYGDTVEILETKTVDGVLWGRVSNGWVCMDYVS